jgi:hypothetical protein
MAHFPFVGYGFYFWIEFFLLCFLSISFSLFFPSSVYLYLYLCFFYLQASSLCWLWNKRKEGTNSPNLYLNGNKKAIEKVAWAQPSNIRDLVRHYQQLTTVSFLQLYLQLYIDD